jgi:hypothetical protein
MILETSLEFFINLRLINQASFAANVALNARIAESSVDHLQFFEAIKKVWMHRVDLIVLQVNVDQVRVVFKDLIGKCFEVVAIQAQPLQVDQVLKGFGFDRLDAVRLKVQIFEFLEFLSK